MDLLQKTKELCRMYNIKPSRAKGQNFLVNENVYNKIIEAAELKENDVVLEVGPGLGFLTTKLAERVKKVIAVELDDKLAEVLRTGLKAQGMRNVKVVNENILDFNPLIPPYQGDISCRPLLKGGEGGYKIVANLPYNITSAFLRKFLSFGDTQDRSAKHKPSLMVLMIQKEVAERIAAKSGEMSLLSVSVQFYAKPEIIEIVPRKNFWPEPEVDSAIVKLGILGAFGTLLVSVPNAKEFFRLVKIGFSARRKMLKNNLANGYHVNQETAENWLRQAGFNPKIRAQELSVEDWIKILEVIRGNMV